jgi:hypothetical protein
VRIRPTQGVELAKLKGLLEGDLAAFNRLVRDKEIPAVVVKAKRERGGSTTGVSP